MKLYWRSSVQSCYYWPANLIFFLPPKLWNIHGGKRVKKKVIMISSLSFERNDIVCWRFKTVELSHNSREFSKAYQKTESELLCSRVSWKGIISQLVWILQKPQARKCKVTSRRCVGVTQMIWDVSSGCRITLRGS